MPVYRLGTGFVHIKMTNTKKRPAPAPCCGRIAVEGIDRRCMAMSTILCDWPVEGGSCDAPLCEEHAHLVGADLHLCARHLKQRADAPELFE